MSYTRLRLDFSLATAQERREFLDSYLTTETFRIKSPTDEELELMGNYVLWGKNPTSGLSIEKEAGLTINTKHNTWNKDNVESLDELLESPTFNEAALSTYSSTQFRKPKKHFSRQEALANCSPEMRQTFLDLFREIDRTELLINYYELLHGKRAKEPRAALLAAFTPEEQIALQQKVTHWTQYRYLNMRHALVQMRTEQYALRDSYRDTIFLVDNEVYQEPVTPDFEAGIEVLPLGLLNKDSPTSHLLFREWPRLVPNNYTEKELSIISETLWQKKNFTPCHTQRWVDFREPEHVFQMLDFLSELEETAAHAASAESNLPALIDTLHFYIDRADLTDIQLAVLEMKFDKKKNADIAATIRQKYGKRYTANYISTIFRKRIIPKICAAAAYHIELVSNIFFPEEFKTCSQCGDTMLRTPSNFMRKSRSNDGFSARCKKCEKAARIKNIQGG